MGSARQPRAVQLYLLTILVAKYVLLGSGVVPRSPPRPCKPAALPRAHPPQTPAQRAKLPDAIAKAQHHAASIRTSATATVLSATGSQSSMLSEAASSSRLAWAIM